MLRIAIPYGSLNPTQLRKLAWIARTYDKGYGHFTTRTEPAAALDQAEGRAGHPGPPGQRRHARHPDQRQLHPQRQRRPLRRRDAEEVDDPRVWAEAIRQWSTVHPEFSYLPRKFKIAVTAAPKDRTAAKTHDIGLNLKRARDGSLGFEVMVGGGLGRLPHIAPTIREFLPANRLFSYLEAILRTYNRHGRRDNIHKAGSRSWSPPWAARSSPARSRAEWEKGGTASDLPDLELARIRGAFVPKTFETLPAQSEAFETARPQTPAFARFARNNLKPHKRPGYSIVEISLKAIGETPGDATSEQMEVVADLAERYGQTTSA
jgi:sulfite reductase (NADPH) hemoprotein beta-component